MTRRVLLFLGGVAAAALMAGFILDAQGFAVNLLAGVAGGCAGVVVAVAVVERLLRRDRAAQWLAVSAQLRRSILGAISDVAFDFYLELVPDLPDGINLFGGATPSDSIESAVALADMLARMAVDIDQRTSDLGAVRPPTVVIRRTGRERVWQKGDPKFKVSVPDERSARATVDSEFHRASSQQLYEAVRPYLKELRNSLLPRLLQVGGSPSLAAALGDVEAAEREWRWAVELIEGDWGAPEELAWSAAAELARSLSTAAERAAKEWD